MPTEYTIDTASELIRTRVWGEFTEADVHDLRRRLTADPAFQPTFSQLVDFSGVDTFSIESDTVRSFVRTDPFEPAVRRAFVASTGLIYGMLRMYESMKGNQQLCVFRSIDEAENWLGISPR